MRSQNISRETGVRARFATAGSHRQRGQGMTEYIIIAALIAVAAITVFGAFGETIRHQVAAMTMEMSGQAGNTELQKNQAVATRATTDAGNSKTLANYATQ